MKDAAGAALAGATWHLLQVSDALDEEFGSALAELVPLLAWQPERKLLPFGKANNDIRQLTDPPLAIHSFPLLRGFARWPWSAIARTGATVSEQLLKQTHQPEKSPLICTSPYFASVAERWPGPVVYWLTDLMAHYSGADAEAVHRLDARMCRVATMVCPNSNRLADYLVAKADCPREKIRVLPNATRACNLLAGAATEPAPLPEDLQRITGPIAGVIGNLAGNMNWLFLAKLTAITPMFTWVFVGPTGMPIQDAAQSSARAQVMEQRNVRFVGKKPYGMLARYARAFDVAVLPYRRCEPTYSGSSTRFYEHLAACRPMIATRGFEELLHKEPLLQLVNTPEEANAALRTLQAHDFDDGMRQLRWQASQQGTWQVRAACMVEELGRFLQRAEVALHEPRMSGPALPI